MTTKKLAPAPPISSSRVLVSVGRVARNSKLAMVEKNTQRASVDSENVESLAHSIAEKSFVPEGKKDTTNVLKAMGSEKGVTVKANIRVDPGIAPLGIHEAIGEYPEKVVPRPKFLKQKSEFTIRGANHHDSTTDGIVTDRGSTVAIHGKSAESQVANGDPKTPTPISLDVRLTQPGQVTTIALGSSVEFGVANSLRDGMKPISVLDKVTVDRKVAIEVVD